MSWCGVRDDGQPGRCSLHLDEHRLIDGDWVHPDWYRAHCGDNPDKCCVCWVCADTKENA